MKKQFLLYFFFLVVCFSFLIRLFYVQVLDEEYKLSGSNQAQQKIKIFPTRGYILDRNHKLMVTNQPAYDLMVISKNVTNLDTSSFCNLLDISKEQFITYWGRMKKKRGFSTYKPNIFIPLISKEEFAKIQEYLHEFEGFSIQSRTLREYPYQGAANVVGYIGEVSEAYIRNHPEYQQGDLIGKAGIDKAYEKQLRGTAGIKYVLVDNHNRVKGPFLNGKYDEPAIAGADLTSTIDIDLQKLGEQLMQGKRGRIVAIEPSSGEILCLVSSPGFDPNLLVGNKRSTNYKKLEDDTLNLPLYDRGLLAQYPPGSPFKIVNALIGLQEGVITPNTVMSCHHGFHFGSLTVACHCGGGPMALRKSISKSCNNYYCSTFKRIVENYPNSHEGMDAWSNHVKSFGLGNYLNNDLPTGTKGLVPNSAYYDRVLGYTGWRAVTTISLGIGQGE
ncbi:MAG: penicillin-binding transpeptidase domain-containing protein, partial [Schleiferiaceae bacterium]|nr:penicillin-binding transpeptidase domain-containing protein [Schleiferiaceae bacterium]